MTVKKEWRINKDFAWYPVFIRNKQMPFRAGSGWVWLKKYTRVWQWNEKLGRYRTYDTMLGWAPKDVMPGKVMYDGEVIDDAK